MLKVLIADDEEKVADLIRNLVPWEELGMAIEAIVPDGFEAIKILEKTRIDILISDARMPGCDGIELIRWCHEKQLPMKYIIISGYRHFEYAHGALQYGVDYYLLKPIKQTELLDALRKISESIHKFRHKEEEEQRIQQLIYLNKDRLRRHFISSYIFNGEIFCQNKIDSLCQINEYYQMNFKSGIYQAVFVKVDIMDDIQLNINLLLDKIKSIMEEAFKECCDEQIGTILHSGVIMLVNYPLELQESFIANINELYERINEMIDVFESLRVVIGISKRENDLRNMNLCIATAGEAIKYRIRNRNAKVIEYDKYSYGRVYLKNLLTTERCEIINSYCHSNNAQGIKKVVHACKVELKQQEDYSPVDLFDFATEVSYLLMRVATEMISENNGLEDIRHNFNEAMDMAATEEQIWENINQLVERTLDCVCAQMASIITKPVREAKEYIDAHYQEAITLEMLANNIGLTANYLSAVFRKETGVNFSEYLIAKRMEMAAELLRKTNRPIADIAGLVGYTDVKYFSKLCKKTLGLKPSEYRKLYL